MVSRKKSTVARLNDTINNRSGGFNEDDIRKIIEEEQKKQQSKGLAYQVIKVLFFLLAITTFLLLCFWYFDVTSLWDTAYIAHKPLMFQLFLISLVATAIIGFVFFFLLDKLDEYDKRTNTTFVLTKDHVQYEKIREWLMKYHGYYALRLVRSDSDPPQEAGESSSYPHTKHFLIKIVLSNARETYVHVANPLFKGSDYFSLRSVGDNYRNTQSHYWYGTPRKSIPTFLKETSALNKGTHIYDAEDLGEDISVTD